MNEELKIIIRAELEQFKKAMKDAVAGIKGVANESRKASKEIDGFTAEVNQQGKALSDLKQKYIDLAKAHGTESKEAKDAAEAIRKLSAEYKTNKALANDLANEADKFDVSLGTSKASQGFEKTNASAEDLSGTLSDIASLNFGSVLLQMVSPAVAKGFSQYADWMEEYRSQMELAKMALDKNSKYYSPLGYNNDWEGDNVAKEYYNFHVGEAEEAMAKTKTITKNTMKEIGSAIKGALKGIVGALIIVAIDIAAIIALAKNALNVAKEVKQMAAEASKIGLETDTYGEWAYVLKQVGIESDKLTDFLKTLADEQNAVRDGSEDIIKAFEDIGLSQEEVAGMDQQTLFNETVKGLQNIENAAERTSIAYRIFGEDAAELANVLYLNNQETQSLIDNYYNLGAAPSDNLINKSKILTGSTTNLSYAWQGLKNTLAEWVIPIIITVVQWITTAIAYINAFLQGIFGIKNAGKDAGKSTNDIGSGWDNNKKKFKDYADTVRRYTMGFDELNIIPKQSTGGSGSDDDNSEYDYSGGGINPKIPVIEAPDLSKFRAWMDEYGGIIQGILTWTAILGGVAMIIGGVMTGNLLLIAGGISVAGLGIAIGAAGGEESHWAKWLDLFKAFGVVFEAIGIAIGNAFDELGRKIKQWWSGVVDWWNTTIAPIFTKAFWIALWNNLKTAASEKLAEIKAKIEEKTAPIKKWFEDKVKPIFTKDYWKTKWNNLVSAASDKLAEMKKKIDEKMAPIKDWFDKKLKPIFSKKYWTDMLAGMKDGLKDGLNKCLENIEKFINNIAKKLGLGKVQEALSVIGIDFNLSEIKIPRLATGGIATSSILANIGEAGREAVLPLENNTGWMDILADRINGRSAPSKIVLMVDGRELGYATINSINSITRQTGIIQLLV